RVPLLVTNFFVFEVMFLNRLAAALAQVPRAATGKPHPIATLGKVVAIGAIVAIASSFRPVLPEPTTEGVLRALGDWAHRPPASIVLAPFLSFSGPIVAHSPRELALSLVPPFAIVVGLLLAVLSSDTAFEEAAIAQSETLKQKIDLIRRTGRMSQPTKARPAPIELPETAGPVLALAWKNYLAV